MQAKEIFSFNKLLALAVPVFLAGLLGACGPSENEQNVEAAVDVSDQIVVTTKQIEASGMQLGSISSKVFSSTIQANGMVDVPPENKASVSTYYGGFVEEISLLPGQKVKKGQILFTLGNPEYVQMQQDFLETKNRLAYLKADFERQKALVQDNIASRKNYLKAETDYNVTLAVYESLKKKLQLININPAQISDTNLKTSIGIYAPIGGYVTKVNATKGMFLNTTDVAVELVNSDHIHLELNVYEKDIQKVHEGQAILFQLPDAGGKWYEAEVHLVGKTVEEESRTINVHGHLKDESLSSLFVPGMYVEARIAIDNQQAMALPEEAIVNVGNKYFVLVLANESPAGCAFVKKEVFTGKTQNKFVEIRNPESFHATDRILTNGAFNLIQ